MAKYINVENIPEWSIQNYGVVLANFYDIIDATELYEDVAPVIHAKWFDTPEPYVYACSHCRTRHYVRFIYCPHCGAIMDNLEVS